MLKDIEKLIKRELPKEVVAGFEPDPNARAQPIQLRSGGGGGGGGNRSGGGGGGRGRQGAAPGVKPSQGPSRGHGGGNGAAPRPAAPRRSGGRGR
jgi:ATP-dependent RNA helicase RhlE